MRCGIVKAVRAGPVLLSVMAGLAACGTVNSIESVYDDSNRPPGVDREVARAGGPESPLPPEGATSQSALSAPPSGASEEPPSPPGRPESAEAGPTSDGPELPAGQEAEAQPTPAAQETVVPQARPELPQRAEGQPTPGGPVLLAEQKAKPESTSSQPASRPQVQERAEELPPPASPPPTPQAEPPAAASQNSLTETARTNQTDDGRKVVPGPEGGNITGALERRIDSLFGSSAPAPVVESSVTETSIIGSWVLNEEDGLRTCALTFSSREAGSHVAAAQGCSGLAAKVSSWGLFGSDLLLNDSGKTVVARLRPSGSQWFGFTLGTGIPVILSRGG